jgi:hypothetical protein
MDNPRNWPGFNDMADEVARLTEEAGADLLKLGRIKLGPHLIMALIEGRYTATEYQDLVRKMVLMNPELRREPLLQQAKVTEATIIALGPSSLEA